MPHSGRSSLLIRADASAQIGTGHVMRCLALAQAWIEDGGHATFAMAVMTPAVKQRLVSEGIEVVHLVVQAGSRDDAVKTAVLATKSETGWLVVDGYHFEPDYQQQIRVSGLHLLLIDDVGCGNQYHADIILNQNLHAHEKLYSSKEPYTQLLLGTPYCLLRREFLKWEGWEREIADPARRVLVTMGGSDPCNMTQKVVQGIQQVNHGERLEVVVVAGSNYLHYRDLQMAIRAAKFPISLIRSATNMAELMAWADVAISGGGSTCWELAFMGLPSLIVILAENQRPIAEEICGTNLALKLGFFEEVTEAKIADALSGLLVDRNGREVMSRNGRKLVDGVGSDRVVSALRSQLRVDLPVFGR